METRISKITEVDNLGTTPARVNRVTGELFINRKIWPKLNKAKRMFILLHEAGHADLQTRSEMEADEYAFNNYVGMGYPLSESVYALTRVLPFDRPGHETRAVAQLNRALQFDKKKSMIPPAEIFYQKSMDHFSDLFGRRKIKKLYKEKEKNALDLAAREKARALEATAKAENAEADAEKIKTSQVNDLKAKAQAMGDNKIYLVAAGLAIAAILFFIIKKRKK